MKTAKEILSNRVMYINDVAEEEAAIIDAMEEYTEQKVSECLQAYQLRQSNLVNKLDVVEKENKILKELNGGKVCQTAANHFKMNPEERGYISELVKNDIVAANASEDDLLYYEHFFHKGIEYNVKVIDQLQREAEHREFNLQELQKKYDALTTYVNERKA